MSVLLLIAGCASFVVLAIMAGYALATCAVLAEFLILELWQPVKEWWQS